MSGSGLTTDGLSWLLFGAMALLWVMSLRQVVDWRLSNWHTAVSSLFGFAWLGFGVNFVLRFLVLSYDSVAFGNMTDRLAIRPASVVNATLLQACIYWFVVALGCRLAMKRTVPGPFAVLLRVDLKTLVKGAPIAIVVATAFMYLALGPLPLPIFLMTPMNLFGGLWAFVAGAVWWSIFRQGRLGLGALALGAFVLAPGAIKVMMSPYREHIIATALIPVIAAVFAGKRPSLWLAALSMVGFFFASTIFVTVQRRVQWSQESLATATQDIGWEVWTENPNTAPWTRIITRFHGFDSSLLTVDLVPDVFPHSRRTVFTDWILEGFVPRAFYAVKTRDRRGPEFAETIWSYGEQVAMRSSIAPSMLGDLYEAGGTLFVALGGLMWGLTIGFVEGWKRRLPSPLAAGLTCLVVMTCVSSAERDFVFAMSSIVQQLLILVVATWFMVPRKRARASGVAPPAVPSRPIDDVPRPTPADSHLSFRRPR